MQYIKDNTKSKSLNIVYLSFKSFKQCEGHKQPFRTNFSTTKWQKNMMFEENEDFLFGMCSRGADNTIEYLFSTDTMVLSITVSGIISSKVIYQSAEISTEACNTSFYCVSDTLYRI